MVLFAFFPMGQSIAVQPTIASPFPRYIPKPEANSNAEFQASGCTWKTGDRDEKYVEFKMPPGWTYVEMSTVPALPEFGMVDSNQYLRFRVYFSCPQSKYVLEAVHPETRFKSRKA